MSRHVSMTEFPVVTNTPRVSVSRVKSRRRFPLGKVLGYLLLLFVAFLYLFPLLYLVNVALKTPNEYLFQPTGLAKGLYLGNFPQGWEQGNFAAYIGNSLLYTLVSVSVSVTLALFVAFPVARGYIKGGTILYSTFLAALFLPNPMIPQFQLMLNLGLYNTQWGYILLNCGAIGIAPLLVVGYLRSVPRELDEAATIDGCGYFRFVLTIIAPLIKPILVTVFLLGAITLWNDIIGPTIYLADSSYYPIALGLFQFFGQFNNQWTVLAASIIMVAAPLIVLYLFLQRYFVDGALAGAVK